MNRLLGLFFALTLAAWPAMAAEKPVLIFAAASLTDALNEISATFSAVGRGEVKASYAASSVLARQIESGAPADIFFSADTIWMDHVAQAGGLDTASRKDLLGNALVLIARKDDPIVVKLEPGFTLAPLLGDRRLAVGDPDSVPAGIYAKAALQHLGLWNGVAGKLAGAENVRSALLYVARGECPLGIVYASDAQIEPRVRIAARFPDDSHPAIVYPIALTKGAHDAAARAFFQFLQGPEAAASFRKFGFTIL